MNMKIKKDSFLFKIGVWLSKHWIVSLIITIAPTWYIFFLGYFGETWGLIRVVNNEEGTTQKVLSATGLVISIVLLVIVLFISIISRYKSLHDPIQKELDIQRSGYALFDKMLTTTSNICLYKLSTQVKLIQSIKRDGVSPPQVYSKPCGQLEKITEELSDCVVFLLSERGHQFSSQDIYVSIAYNFPLEDKNKWKWTDLSNEKGLSLDELMNDDTTFSFLLSQSAEQHSSVFFNSKQDAFEKNHYKPDKYDVYDKAHKLEGSIACYLITIKRSDTEYIRAVLSVSSYRKKFVDESNDDRKQEDGDVVETVRQNIENVIIAELSERIKIELCNYYLQFLYQQAKKANINE